MHSRTSVHSRTSSHGNDPHDDYFREESVPRDADQSQRHPSPFNRTTNSSLGVSNTAHIVLENHIVLYIVPKNSPFVHCHICTNVKTDAVKKIPNDVAAAINPKSDFLEVICE